MNFFCPFLENVCPLLDICPVRGSLPTFKFWLGWQLLTPSRFHARSRVSVYHLSLGPQGRNPLLGHSTSILCSRSARYNCCHMAQVTMHAVKFLYTAIVQCGLKIHCNTNHHAMTMSFLILQGLLPDAHFDAQSLCQKVINFNPSLLLCCVNTASVWNTFYLNCSSLPCVASHCIKQVL